MANSEHIPMAKYLADGADHTGRVFRARCGDSKVMFAANQALTQSHELMAVAEAMLAKAGGAMIEEYYRRG